MDNYELFNSFLDEKIQDKTTKEITNYTVREYLEDDSIKSVEDNICFFNDIPEEEMKAVFSNLIEILFTFDTSKREEDFAHMWVDSLEKPVKPSIKIKQDILTIKKYQKMVQELYGTKSKKDDNYIFLNIPKELSQNYDNNQKIIRDLEAQKFNIISRSNYYATKKQTKNELKIFLDDLVSKYSLKNISDYKKPMIDAINPKIPTG